MEKKKGFMVMCPAGAFKSPNDPDCPICKAMGEVAHAAAAMLAPNREGLRFIAATHAAHYQNCEVCKAANPDPNPIPNAEDREEARQYDEGLKKHMAEVEKDPLAALLGAIGVDRDELLAEMQKVLGDDPTREGRYAFRAQEKRTIGFVN